MHAEILINVPGALWTVHMLDGERAQAGQAVSTAIYRGETIEMVRVVVAVDPSGKGRRQG